MASTVTQEYLMGIKEGRTLFKQHGISIAQDSIANLKSTIKGFTASSPVGQMLRGELAFWTNQLKIAK